MGPLPPGMMRASTTSGPSSASVIIGPPASRAASARALRGPCVRSPVTWLTTAGRSASGAAHTATAPARSMTSNVSIASATSLPSIRPQPVRTSPTRFAMPVELPRGRREFPSPADNDLARAAGEVQVVLEVVDGGEAVIQQLLGVKQVRQVRAAVRRAALAGTTVLDRARVVAVLRVGDVDAAGAHEQLAVARVA